MTAPTYETFTTTRLHVEGPLGAHACHRAFTLNEHMQTDVETFGMLCKIAVEDMRDRGVEPHTLVWRVITDTYEFERHPDDCTCEQCA